MAKRKRLGRPKGSGVKPRAKVRRHRIPAMFTDAELRQLKALAKSQEKPLATVVYELAMKGTEA